MEAAFVNTTLMNKMKHYNNKLKCSFLSVKPQ